MGRVIKGGVSGLAVLFLLAGFASDLMAQAAAPQERAAQTFDRYFQPYITVQEVYDSNIFLARPELEKEDWITTVTPGIRFSKQDAFTGLLMDVNGGYNWYASNDDLNYWSAQGILEARYSPSRAWNFRVRDSLIRSDEPRERQFDGLYDQTYASLNQNRSIYYRNVVEPSVEYLFARESSLRVAYANEYYDIKDPLSEDSMSNRVSPTLTYWFNIRNGVQLAYEYSNTTYDFSPDLVEQLGRFRYTYRFNPATSVFAEGIYEWLDSDAAGADYYVITPSIGIQHAFSRTLSGSLQVGHFYQDPDVGESQDGLSLNANLSLRSELTTYTLFALGGYRTEYQTADNLGFIQYYRGGLSLSHRLLQRLTLGLGADVEWDDYQTGEEVLIYSANVSMTYQVLRWMNIAAGVTYLENDSQDIEANDYTDWRGFITLNLTYGEGPRPATGSIGSIGGSTGAGTTGGPGTPGTPGGTGGTR